MQGILTRLVNELKTKYKDAAVTHALNQTLLLHPIVQTIVPSCSPLRCAIEYTLKYQHFAALIAIALVVAQTG